MFLYTLSVVVLIMLFVIVLWIYNHEHKKQIQKLKSQYEDKLNNKVVGQNVQHQAIGALTEKNNGLLADLQKRDYEIEELRDQLVDEVDKNKKILSQKKSSEVRLGLTSEKMLPFLAEFPYDPSHCTFLGNPLDYIVFNLDQGEIVFVEIKSGGAKESKRQKTIRELIKQGHVFYEKIRINSKGIKVTREKNDG